MMLEVTNVPLFTMLMTMLIHIPLSYIFVFIFEMGIEGLALASGISGVSQLVLMMIFASFEEEIQEALFIPTADSLFEWTHYIYMAIPSVVMVLLWTISQEFTIVFAGVLGVNELAAMTLIAGIGLQISMIGQAMSETLAMFVENLLSQDEA